MHRSRMAFALSLTVPLLLVSACSSDPEPKVAPPTSPKTSVSTSPTPSGPVKPVMPEAAKAHTAAGAEAFVKYYWAAADYASATGDVSGLRPLATKGCEACAGGIRAIHQIYAQGGTIRGGATTVRVTKSGPVTFGDEPAFAVIADIVTARQIVDLPQTSADETHRGATTPIRFVLEPSGDGLVMAYWDVVS